MNTEVVVVENPVDGVAKVIKNAKVSFANCNPKIGDGGCGELSLSLKKAKTVFLNLADQEIEASGLKTLLDVLKNSTSLLHLDVGKNPIGDEGADVICNFLETNKSIVELYLYDTQITDEGAKKLEAALGKNKTLKRLDLNDNHIAKEQKSKISEILLKRA